MIAFTNLTKERKPALLWEKAKNDVLGKKYDLSVVLAGEGLLRKLNRQYRGEKKPAGVLSFPLSKERGEIFLNLSRIKKEARGLGLPKAKYLAFLYVHSLLHLKGQRHGVRMQREEKRVMKLFDFEF